MHNQYQIGNEKLFKYLRFLILLFQRAHSFKLQKLIKRKMIQGSISQYQQSTYCQSLFSELFIVQDLDSCSQVVQKRAKENSERLLRNQYQILKKLQNKEGFPRLGSCEYDQFGQIKTITIQKLSISLKTLISNCNATGTQLPIDFIIHISLQMLERIESLHQTGYLHIDLKPEHFLFQSNDPESCLYLIDFGLSAKINQIQQKSSEQSLRKECFRGNITYSSLNRMKCEKQSILDDLESLLYIIGQIMEGQLPWKPKDSNIKEKRNWKILFSKVLSKKTRRNGWNKYGVWINETLNKIRLKQDPYYQLRSSICKLAELDL